MIYKNYSPRKPGQGGTRSHEDEEEKSDVEAFEHAESKYDSRLILGENMETLNVEDRFVGSEEQE